MDLFWGKSLLLRGDRRNLLLLGGSLLGGLLGSLLGCGLLGSLLGSRLLGGLLGLGSLLGSGLLGGLGLLGLLGSGLLGLGLLGGQLEASCSLLASSGNNLLASDQLPQGKLDTDTGLGSVDLVVGNDHVGIGRVGGRLGDLLNLGGLGFWHFDDFV